MNTYMGLRIVESIHAVKKDGLNFPYSPHRSGRVLKKLLKRFGGQIRYSPTAYVLRDTLVIHPELLDRLRRGEQRPEHLKGLRIADKADCWFEEHAPGERHDPYQRRRPS